jgi:3-hydroxyisobutyrate dehydrogenase-like beta-hydroxyacid dehydrogenase
MSASDSSEERKLNLVSSMLEAIHIVTALEALSLGAKTGVDVGTLFEVIHGAAGNSAMFAAAGRELVLGQTEGKVDSLDALVRRPSRNCL